MSDGIALLIFNLVVGIFTMCQALISIYKIFRRNRETITATSNENNPNIEQSLTVNVPVQNVDNRSDLNDVVVMSIDTMDETYVFTIADYSY